MNKLNLRFHQKLIVYKTLEIISKGDKEILIAAKPRSGKTYIVGGIILEFCKNKISNILVVTPAPKETMDQFLIDLFKKYYDFKNFNILNPITSNEIINLKLKNNISNIILVSKQVLQLVLKNNIIKNINLFFFDENHFGGTTDLSINMINKFSNKNTIKIYLTATFQKSLETFNISIQNILNWDLEDEIFCKQRNIKNLILKHGKIVKNFIKSDNDLKIYDEYPSLLILTILFDSKFYNKLKMSNFYLIKMSDIFKIELNKFKNENFVKIIVSYIYKEMFLRINNISLKYNSKRMKTQIWFLPTVNIDEISYNLKIICENTKGLSNFDYLILNSKNNYKDIKKHIYTCELKAKLSKKDGLIIFVGNMLQLGITLKNCDTVILLNHTMTYDRITQSIYRCMSESNGKKFGYVIDFNISRVLESLLKYNTYNKSLSNIDKIKYLIENKIINIDIDKGTTTQIIKKLISFYNDNNINENIIHFFNTNKIKSLLLYMLSILNNDIYNQTIYNQIQDMIENINNLTLIQINKFLYNFIINIKKYNLNDKNNKIIFKIYDMCKIE